jgi:hypothetical protein
MHLWAPSSPHLQNAALCASNHNGENQLSIMRSLAARAVAKLRPHGIELAELERINLSLLSQQQDVMGPNLFHGMDLESAVFGELTGKMHIKYMVV